MKNKIKFLLLIMVLVGVYANAQEIRVRGVGVSVWNVNGKTPSPNQMIYSIPIGIKFENRAAYTTLEQRHFWIDRTDRIANKDYATTPRSQDSNIGDARINAISADRNTTLLIAVPLSAMEVDGWTRVPGAFKTSIQTLYTYTYNYTTPNRWIDIPHFNNNVPTIVFADKGKLVFDNPISIASQSEGVIIEDKNIPYNRKNSGTRSFYSFDPNLLVLPNGKYIAGRNGARFISEDKGKSWKPLNDKSDIDHATVFSHKGEIYLIGDAKGSSNHNTLIAKSTDEGKSWGPPVDLGFVGRNSPSPVVVQNGRLWIALEDKPSANVIIASVSVNSNLLNPKNWALTNRPDNPKDYTNDDNEPYIALGRNGFPIAFSINEGPVQATGVTSAREIITYGDFRLPSKRSKSDIKYDSVTDKYWALTSASTVPGTRAGVTLFSSDDLKTWTKEREPIKATAPDFHGFSYAFMQFDGDDIVFACRTAWENKAGLPQRWHDSNMLTFHRIRNFRGSNTTAPTCSIVPYTNINNEKWNIEGTVGVQVNDDVWFGPQSKEFGITNSGWSWKGPNGFIATGRELIITNIQPSQTGKYTVSNKNSKGCTSSYSYTVTVPSSLLEGTYHLRNVKSGEYLDTDANGVTGQVRQPIGQDKQWNLKRATDGYYYIDNAMTDRGPLAAAPSMGPIRYLAERFNNISYKNREWQAIQISGNTYKFLNKDAKRGYITSLGLDQVVSSANGSNTAAHWELIRIGNKPKSSTIANQPLRIFPVPSNGVFNIDPNGSSITYVAIFSISGQLIYEKSFGTHGTSALLPIDEDFASGVYLVKAMDSEGIQINGKLLIDK